MMTPDSNIHSNNNPMHAQINLFVAPGNLSEFHKMLTRHKIASSKNQQRTTTYKANRDGPDHPCTGSYVVACPW